jgi:hypothetical protein
MIRTGISASVAAKTNGSNGMWTRPEPSCCYNASVFASRWVGPATVGDVCLPPV